MGATLDALRILAPAMLGSSGPPKRAQHRPPVPDRTGDEPGTGLVPDPESGFAGHITKSPGKAFLAGIGNALRKLGLHEPYRPGRPYRDQLGKLVEPGPVKTPLGMAAGDIAAILTTPNPADIERRERIEHAASQIIRMKPDQSVTREDALAAIDSAGIPTETRRVLLDWTERMEPDRVREVASALQNHAIDPFDQAYLMALANMLASRDRMRDVPRETLPGRVEQQIAAGSLREGLNLAAAANLMLRGPEASASQEWARTSILGLLREHDIVAFEEKLDSNIWPDEALTVMQAMMRQDDALIQHPPIVISALRAAYDGNGEVTWRELGELYTLGGREDMEPLINYIVQQSQQAYDQRYDRETGRRQFERVILEMSRQLRQGNEFVPAGDVLKPAPQPIDPDRMTSDELKREQAFLSNLSDTILIVLPKDAKVEPGKPIPLEGARILYLTRSRAFERGVGGGLIAVTEIDTRGRIWRSSAERDPQADDYEKERKRLTEENRLVLAFRAAQRDPESDELLGPHTIYPELYFQEALAGPKSPADLMRKLRNLVPFATEFTTPSAPMQLPQEYIERAMHEPLPTEIARGRPGRVRPKPWAEWEARAEAAEQEKIQHANAWWRAHKIENRWNDPWYWHMLAIKDAVSPNRYSVLDSLIHEWQYESERLSNMIARGVPISPILVHQQQAELAKRIEDARREMNRLRPARQLPPALRPQVREATYTADQLARLTREESERRRQYLERHEDDLGEHLNKQYADLRREAFQMQRDGVQWPEIDEHIKYRINQIISDAKPYAVAIENYRIKLNEFNKLLGQKQEIRYAQEYADYRTRLNQEYANLSHELFEMSHKGATPEEIETHRREREQQILDEAKPYLDTPGKYLESDRIAEEADRLLKDLRKKMDEQYTDLDRALFDMKIEGYEPSKIEKIRKLREKQILKEFADEARAVEEVRARLEAFNKDLPARERAPVPPDALRSPPPQPLPIQAAQPQSPGAITSSRPPRYPLRAVRLRDAIDAMLQDNNARNAIANFPDHPSINLQEAIAAAGVEQRDADALAQYIESQAHMPGFKEDPIGFISRQADVARLLDAVDTMLQDKNARNAIANFPDHPSINLQEAIAAAGVKQRDAVALAQYIESQAHMPGFKEDPIGFVSRYAPVYFARGGKVEAADIIKAGLPNLTYQGPSKLPEALESPAAYSARLRNAVDTVLQDSGARNAITNFRHDPTIDLYQAIAGSGVARDEATAITKYIQAQAAMPGFDTDPIGVIRYNAGIYFENQSKTGTPVLYAVRRTFEGYPTAAYNLSQLASEIIETPIAQSADWAKAAAAYTAAMSDWRAGRTSQQPAPPDAIVEKVWHKLGPRDFTKLQAETVVRIAMEQTIGWEHMKPVSREREIADQAQRRRGLIRESLGEALQLDRTARPLFNLDPKRYRSLFLQATRDYQTAVGAGQEPPPPPRWLLEAAAKYNKLNFIEAGRVAQRTLEAMVAMQSTGMPMQPYFGATEPKVATIAEEIATGSLSDADMSERMARLEELLSRYNNTVALERLRSLPSADAPVPKAANLVTVPAPPPRQQGFPTMSIGVPPGEYEGRPTVYQDDPSAERYDYGNAITPEQRAKEEVSISRLGPPQQEPPRYVLTSDFALQVGQRLGPSVSHVRREAQKGPYEEHMAWINLGYQWNRMRGLPPDARIPHELLQVSTRRIGDRMEAAAARILTGDQINAIGAMSGSTLTPARRVADAFVNAQDLSQFGITPEQEAQLQQAFADMHSEAREAVATTIVRYARDNPEMLRGLGDANVQALMRELGGGRPAHGLPKPYTEGYTAALPGAALRREVDPATGALTSKFGPASLEAISRDPWGYRALMASSEGKWGPWQKEFTTRVQQEASQIADRLATGMLNEEQARIIKSHKTDPTRPPVNMHGEGYNSPEYAERLARAIRYAREGRDPTVQRWLQENALILEQNLPGTKSLAEATPQEIVAASVAAMNDRTIIVRPQPIELMMKSGSDPAEYAEHLADAIQDARAGRNRIMQEWLEENAPILERKIRADKPVPTPEASPQEIVAATVAAMFDRTIAEHPPELSLRHGEQYSSASYGLRLIDAIQDARAGRNPTMKRWLEANATILQQAIPGNKDITAATPRELVSAVIAAIDNKLTAVRPIDLNLQPGEWYDSPAYAARLAEAISDARAGYRPIMKKWLQENALILERKIPGNKRVMPAATLTVGTATPRQVAEAAIAAISENLITVHPTALIPEKGEAYDSLAYRSRLAHAIQEAHAGHNPTMKRWLEANATVLQQNLIGGTGQAPPDLSAASPRQVAEAAIAAMNKNLIGQPVGSREERDFESAKAASDHLNMLATIAHYAKSAGAITAPNELGPGKHPWRPPVNMEPGERYNSPEYAEHLAEAIQDARAGRFPVMQKWLSDHAPILERNIPGDKLLAQASPQEIVAAAVAAMENHERGLRVDSEGYVIDPAYDKRIGRIPLPIERGEKTQVEAAKTAWKKIIEDLAFRWHGIDPRSAAQLRSLGFPLPDIIRPFSPREVGTTISRRDLEELRKVLRQITPDNFDG